MLEERYQIAGEEEPVKMLGRIAETRGCLLKGGELDLSKAAGILIDDFRSGRLGRITLEFAPKEQ